MHYVFFVYRSFVTLLSQSTLSYPPFTSEEEEEEREFQIMRIARGFAAHYQKFVGCKLLTTTSLGFSQNIRLREL